jgi:nucleoside-diphosphate-sugar epimerase
MALVNGQSSLRVVVTGGAGYFGSMTVSRLLQDGHQVSVVDKLTYGARPLLAFRGHPGFRLIRADVRREEDLCDAFNGAAAVVHLAAIVGEPACAIDESEARHVNHDGTLAALHAAQRNNVALFIFSSTCSNYGLASPDTLADEDATLQPLSEYARSKIAAEQAVLAANSSIPTLVFRFATLCGLSPRMRFDLLVNDLARAAACGAPIDIFAPKAWRPFVHVRDAANHIAMAIQLAGSGRLNGGRVYNVVGENYQKSDLVDLVFRHFPSSTISVTDRNPDPRDYRVSGERIRTELGFETQLSVEDAFVEVAEAVKMGVFEQPFSPEHAEIPDDASRLFAN